MTTHHPLGILTAVAMGATAAAQTGWVQLLPAVQPPLRAYHAMTFDLARGTTLMFGGWTATSGSSTLADTWEWNGVNWVARVTAHSPPARCGNALAADLNRGRIVLFGGTNVISNSDMNDTWEYDGNDWAQVPTQNQPSARRFSKMEYDATRARVVLFGGGLGGYGTPVHGDTWEWDGASWTFRTPAASPPARWGHGMAYDFARARIVLTNGSPGGTAILMADAWTWDGTNWSQVPAAPTPPTTGLGLANDPVHEVVVRFGGVGTGAETWLFDHVSWRRDPRSLAPSSRSWFPLAHDVPRGRTILFGGAAGAAALLNDTWEYDPGAIARWTPSGSGCPGTSGVPALQPASGSLPIVGSTFVLELLGVPGSGAAISIGFSNQQWNGNPLPWDLGTIGMTGCTLHVSPDFVSFAPVVAGRATLSWQVPNAPGLIGTRFFDQGFALDPAANPLGAIVSNAGAGIVGPF